MESHRPFLVDEEEHEHEEEEVEALVGRKRDRDGGFGAGVYGRENRNDDENGGGNGGVGGHQQEEASAAARSRSRSRSRSSSSCCTESGVEDEEVAEETTEADRVEEEEGGVALFSVHSDKEQGSELADDRIEQVKGNVIEEAIFDTNIGDPDVLSYHSDANKSPIIVKNNDAVVKAFEKEDWFGFDPTVKKEAPAEHGMHNGTPNNGYNVDESVDFIEEEEEVDVEGSDYDVEKVLEKQNTHDLICPNCQSCITRKVILRRRKRKVRSLRRKQKLTNKPETVTEFVVETNSSSLTNDQQGPGTETISSDQTPPHSTEEEGHTDKDVDGFRCLSCFSFFIPTGSGFKLFRTSKSTTENETVQLSQDTTSAKTNWFYSIFSPNKARSKTEEGNTVADNSKAQESYLNQSNEEATPLIISRGDVRLDNSQGQESSQSLFKAEEQTIQNTKDAPQRSSSSSLTALPNQHVQNGHLVSQTAIVEEHKSAVTSEEHVNDIQATSTTEIHQSGQNIVISTTIGMPALANLRSDDGLKAVIVADGNHKTSPHVEEPIQLFQALPTTETNGARIDASISSPLGVPVTEKVQGDGQLKDSIAVTKQDTGNNLEVIVEPVPLSYAASQREPDVGTTVEVRSTPQSEPQTTTPGVAGVGIDILKCIVYGGLIESITSLGVVSSAAGSGAKTMNILALGLANLIGGLFVIFHNLFDLKGDRPRENSVQTSEQDRYQELLGRRGHFTLHATVAILSYLIFGLLPPVIYGVAFRTSDNRDYKLVAVGTASLICIILLAIGKAHVQGQRRYIKTMLYFVILGVMASGASYVVGDLIDILLKKIGWSESSSLDLAMTFPELGPPERQWSSY